MAESFQSTFGGLLVRIKPDVGGDFGGKIYLIPENSLQQFELVPTDAAGFNKVLAGKSINIDYAVFRQDMSINGNRAAHKQRPGRRRHGVQRANHAGQSRRWRLGFHLQQPLHRHR